MDADGDAYAALLRKPDQQLDLTRAALLIARGEYPSLDIGSCLRELARIATAARVRLTADAPAGVRLQALNDTLFDELGFQGSVDGYYDPRNSYLNDVLERRRGIPIALSLLYMDVGGRLGMTLHGVNFPGHFLLRLALRRGALIIDPFHRGRLLDRDELLARLQRATGNPLRFDLRLLDRLLAATPKRVLLARALRNLRAIYCDRRDYPRALRVADQLCQTLPDSADDVRERGAILQLLDCAGAALADYRRYLRLIAAAGGKAGDAIEIEARIRALDAGRPTLN